MVQLLPILRSRNEIVWSVWTIRPVVISLVVYVEIPRITSNVDIIELFGQNTLRHPEGVRQRIHIGAKELAL